MLQYEPWFQLNSFDPQGLRKNRVRSPAGPKASLRTWLDPRPVPNTLLPFSVECVIRDMRRTPPKDPGWVHSGRPCDPWRKIHKRSFKITLRSWYKIRAPYKSNQDTDPDTAAPAPPPSKTPKKPPHLCIPLAPISSTQKFQQQYPGAEAVVNFAPCDSM